MVAYVTDTIGPHLDVLIASAGTRVVVVMEEGAREVESHAKSNAPWADRTGAARAGLTSRVYEEGGEVVLELAHTVDYGVWLETIQSGRFAIIMPTLEALGPHILEAAGAATMSIQGLGGFE